jgi:putative ABC transport system permease protein
LSTLWIKVWADLWQHKGQTLLAISSIAIGVFCVGTLFGMIDLQLSKMDAAHLQSQPSHINLILRQDADLSLLPEIAALSGVQGIDTLTPLTIRYKFKDVADWQSGTLIIRAQPAEQHYDLTSLFSGQWPTEGQIAIERLSARQTGLAIADKVEIEANQGNITLPVSGIVRHPFVKPPKFGGQIHFFADTSVARHLDIKENSFRQLLVRIKPPYSAEKARELAKQIRTLLNKHHIGVNVTFLQDPKQHWGRPFFAGINKILQLLGIGSLLMACVLIFNTVTAHITQQTHQIGIMKSLGGSMLTMIKLYLAEILIMAIVAVTLALPPSLLAAHFSSCALLALFNIDCAQITYSTRAITIMLAGGLFMPLIAALWPICRGATMNVRESIASYGLGSDFGHNVLDRAVECFGSRFLSTLNAAALANLFRRKGRLLLTQLVLIVVGVFFLILMSLIASVNLTLDNEMARTRYDVRLGFTRDQDREKITQLARSIPNANSIELWQRLPVEMSMNGNQLKQKGSLGVQMLALPAASQMYQPLIESGRWFSAKDVGNRYTIISADTAKLNGINIGDRINIKIGSSVNEWQVIGQYRWLAGTNFAVEPVYAPLDTVIGLTQAKDTASFAFIKAVIHNRHEESTYLDALKKVFQENHMTLDVYTTLAKLEQRHYARHQLNPVVFTLFGLAVLMACVGGIGLSGALTIAVLQRRREIGVLRAIGATSKIIYRLFFLEGLLHGMFAWGISVPLAFIAAKPIAFGLGKTLFGIQLDYRFDMNAVWYWLIILLSIVTIATYSPAKKASLLSIKETLD